MKIRLEMIKESDSSLSVMAQCKMVNISRSSYYDYKKEKGSSDQELKENINCIYAANPAYGSRRITNILQRSGVVINRKKTQRLMREMGIEGIYPKRNLSMQNYEHRKYPFIAREKPLVRPNQVWSADITYLKTTFGTVYLVAIIDWYSRFIMSWKMSNTMTENFCIETLQEALKRGRPEIFNTDQGSQFTGNSFISVILQNNICPSMDGKGRATDNAPIERFWRSVKWEHVHLYELKTYSELQQHIKNFIKFYNHERPHQSLGYKTPSEVHFGLERKPFDFKSGFLYTEKELQYVKAF
jgi:putative transposase